jgi:transcriptional regulator with XRE-family HTH domain
VDARADIREFLTTRRARITPEQAGLPAYGGAHRRVKGLRREEVSMLAGISVEYYTRLERGNVSGVSEDVIEAITRALHLDEAEHQHLIDLVRAGGPTRPGRRRQPQARVRPGVQRLLDNMVASPAIVRNARLDVLAVNRLGEAFYAPMYDDPVRPVNAARFVFLSRSAKDFFLDWDTIANDTVSMLRAEAGRDPYDRNLSDLIGELSTRSDDFRVRWASHDVKQHISGVKRFHHPVVGDLTLDYEVLDLAADAGQSLLVYTAEPGSTSSHALQLLASWSSNPGPHDHSPWRDRSSPPGAVTPPSGPTSRS